MAVPVGGSFFCGRLILAKRLVYMFGIVEINAKRRVKLRTVWVICSFILTTVVGACPLRGDETQNFVRLPDLIAHTLIDLGWIAIPVEVHRRGCIRNVQASTTVFNLNVRDRRLEMRLHNWTITLFFLVLCLPLAAAASWHIETPDSAGNVGEYNSLAVDAGGHPHISYYGNSGDLT